MSNRSAEPLIEFDETEVRVLDSAGAVLWSLEWRHVRWVDAVLRDSCTLDHIELHFASTLTASTFELDDETSGWSALADRFADLLPGVERNWYNQVAFPPLSEKRVRIYTRPNEVSKEAAGF